MKIVTQFALPVLLVASVHAQEYQWMQNPTNMRWYGTLAHSMSWPDAQASAVTNGAHLVTVHNVTENTWIATNLGAPSLVGLWDGFWIGLNDIATEGTFVWASGESVPYTNWNPGSPGGANDDAVTMSGSIGWRWDDIVTSAPLRLPLVDRATKPLHGWTFPATYTAGTGVGVHAVADVNGDGRTDVVVPNQNTNNLSIFLAQANGTLVGSTIPCAGGPVAVEFSLVNQDAFLDLIVACNAGMELRTFVGNGTGAFAFDTAIPVGAKPQALIARDLDGDGDRDIAFTTVDGQDRLRTLYRGPTGVFGSGQSYGTGSRPWHLNADDLDGDGDVDIVVSCRDSGEFGLYQNVGNGNFVSGALLTARVQPGRAAIGHLNSDGFLDLAIPSGVGNNIRIVWGLGGLQFDTGGPVIPSGSQPQWVEIGDFDGDGLLDLSAACFAGDLISLHRRTGPDTFAPHTNLRVGDGPVCVRFANVSGDGRAEIVSSLATANRVAVLENLARDCNGNGIDDPIDLANGPSLDCNHNGIPDECDLAMGATFDCDTNGIVDSCEIAGNPGLDRDTDGTLDECEPLGTPFCFGDGTGSACPCDPGQAGAVGTGCRNSIGLGSRLWAVGNASVALDSVTLRVNGLEVVAPGLFFQGSQQQNAGLGSHFGDGLLCVNLNVIRMKIRTASGGMMSVGRDVPGDIPISVNGSVPAGGATRYYQVWYRNSAAFCSTATFNLSNGVGIVWTP